MKWVLRVIRRVVYWVVVILVATVVGWYVPVLWDELVELVVR